MVRIIKQGEYTSTIYKLIADGDFKEASQILESGKIMELGYLISNIHFRGEEKWS